jgi:phage gpG-like protein
VAGKEAVRHFRDNFRKGGFLDKNLERWKPRKKNRDDANRKKGRRALLVQSGDLRRSIRIINTGQRFVVIGTDVKYANIHNEGGTIRHPGGTPYIVIHKDQKKRVAFISFDEAEELRSEGIKTNTTNPHDIPMPKRKFIGRSYVLEYRIKRWLTSQLGDMLR